jgi:hypothetical protein
MKTALFLVAGWLWISIALLRFWPIRRRPDVWPFTLAWPAVLVLVVAILLYEGAYRLFRAARRHWRRP